MAKCCADAWHIIAVLGGLTLFNFFGIYFGIKSDKRDYDMYVHFLKSILLLFFLAVSTIKYFIYPRQISI